MTKVIKREFEKLEDVNDKDVSLTCGTSLEVFNNELNRLSGMDDDLFTYEVEVANILCDLNKDDDSEQRMLHEADVDIGYDPFDVAFTEWLGSKLFNYKTMDHYTKKAIWIYWIRGDDEVELTDEESSDNEDEVVEVFSIDTNIFDFETPIDIPWVDEKPWTDTGVWTEPTPVKHYCKPFNYKTGYSEWPTCSWKNDRYCNGGNLPEAYIVGDSLHYQDYEWYEALKDSELKEQDLRNKAIMEGLISDDESSDDETQELCETYELSVFSGPFQGGGYRVAALGFYQRNNVNPSYQERRQSMEETLSKFMRESANRHKENSNLIKKSELRQMLPFITKEHSLKLRNPKSGNMSYGASVSIMPLLTYLNLGLGELAHTKLKVELADKTMKYPKGIAENVLVGIGKFVFPMRRWKNGSHAGTLAYMRWNEKEAEDKFNLKTLLKTKVLPERQPGLLFNFIESVFPDINTVSALYHMAY
ncbi:hypothetical protein Tco_0360879 [Tanacetum coccineum]